MFLRKPVIYCFSFSLLFASSKTTTVNAQELVCNLRKPGFVKDELVTCNEPSSSSLCVRYSLDGNEYAGCYNGGCAQLALIAENLCCCNENECNSHDCYNNSNNEEGTSSSEEYSSNMASPIDVNERKDILIFTSSGEIIFAPRSAPTIPPRATPTIPPRATPPTMPPFEVETDAPVFTPTKKPRTSKPTQAPTKVVITAGDGEYETQGPTFKPTTKKPTIKPTNKPTITKKPTFPETEAPVFTNFPTKPTFNRPPSTEITDEESSAPTFQPNEAPTFPESVTELDAYVFTDQSRSISLANPECLRDNGQRCWDLQVDFARRLKADLGNQLGFYDPLSGSNDGLRYYLSSFSCRDGKPVTNVFLRLTGYESAMNAALNTMAQQKPLLGTCPSQGLEAIYESMKFFKARNPGRGNSVLIIVTDGRFLDADVRASNTWTSEMINLGAEIFAVAVGSNIDIKNLKGVTQDQSGSSIVSIDSFQSLASEGPQRVIEKTMQALKQGRVQRLNPNKNKKFETPPTTGAAGDDTTTTSTTSTTSDNHIPQSNSQSIIIGGTIAGILLVAGVASAMIIKTRNAKTQNKTIVISKNISEGQMTAAAATFPEPVVFTSVSSST